MADLEHGNSIEDVPTEKSIVADAMKEEQSLWKKVGGNKIATLATATFFAFATPSEAQIAQSNTTGNEIVNVLQDGKDGGEEKPIVAPDNVMGIKLSDEEKASYVKRMKIWKEKPMLYVDQADFDRNYVKWLNKQLEKSIKITAAGNAELASNISTVAKEIIAKTNDFFEKKWQADKNIADAIALKPQCTLEDVAVIEKLIASRKGGDVERVLNSASEVDVLKSYVVEMKKQIAEHVEYLQTLISKNKIAGMSRK